MIDNEAAWLSLVRARNATSHAYDEQLARRVVQTVRRRFPVLRDTLPNLERRLAALETEEANPDE